MSRREILLSEVVPLGKELSRNNLLGTTVTQSCWQRQDVAVKQWIVADIVFAKTEQDDTDAVFQQALLTAQTVSHAHIVSVFGGSSSSSIGERSVYLVVTELMPQGSLRRVLDEQAMSLSWRRKLLFALDIALGMNYLHQQQHCGHGLLSSCNILANRDLLLKITDVGFREFQTRIASIYGRHVDNPPWAAPELIQQLESTAVVTEQSDVYSFGVVVWEIITCLHAETEFMAALMAFQSKRNSSCSLADCLFPYPAKTTADAHAVLMSIVVDCVSNSPQARPSFDQIIERLQIALQEVDSLAPLGSNVSVDGIIASKLVCAICFEMFDTPKLLPCGHTFCRDCLEPLIRGRASFRCPTCRAECAIPQGGVGSLRSNFALIAAIDHFPPRPARLDFSSNPAIIISTMRAHLNNIPLQIHGCMLLEMSANTDAATLEQRYGAHTILVETMKANVHNPAVQESACRVLARLAVDRANKLLLIADAHPSHSALIEAMKNHPANVQVQEIAARTLASLAINTDNKRVLMEPPYAVQEVLVAAMKRHFNHVSLQESCCRAIANLACCDSGPQIMVSPPYEVHIPLVAAMRAHPHHAGVQENACRAFANLAFEDSNEAKLTHADVEAHVCLLAAMRLHPNHTQIQENVCLALANMSTDRNNKLMLSKEPYKIHEMLLAAMRDAPGNSSIQADGSRALSNLIIVHDNLTVMTQPPYLIHAAIINALCCHPQDNDVGNSCCSALINILSYSSSDKAFRHQLLQPPYEIHRILLKMMASKTTSEILHKALSAFNIIINDSALSDYYPDFLPMMVLAPFCAIDIVFQVLLANPKHKKIQSLCIFCLARFSYLREIAGPEMTRLNIASTLETLKDSFGAEEDLVRSSIAKISFNLKDLSASVPASASASASVSTSWLSSFWESVTKFF